MSVVRNEHQYRSTPYPPEIQVEDDEERAQFIPKSHQSNGSSTEAIANHGLLDRLAKLYGDNVGLLLVVAAQIFFAFMNLFVKLLTDLDRPVDALELIWIRMFVTYICCVSWMLYAKVDHVFSGPPGVRLLLVGRGVSGFFGLFGIYYSLQYLSLSDATVLTFLAPTFTSVAGRVFLKEPFSRREAFAGLISLIGVVLIARPASLFGSGGHDSSSGREVASTQRLVAVGVALVGVLGATGAYTTIRAIGTKAHAMHSMAFFSLYCIIVSTAMMIALRVPIVIPRQGLFVLFLFLIGIFGFLAQTLLVLGLQRETASRGTLGLYTLILFSGVLEQIFLHSRPSILSIVGTAIILGSAIYVALTKQSSKKTSATNQVHWDDDIEGQSPDGYSQVELQTSESHSMTKSDLPKYPPVASLDPKPSK